MSKKDVKFWRAKKALAALGLPGIIKIIRNGDLLAIVEKTRQDYRLLTLAMDAWELANPNAYAMAPWHDAREAWKSLGRKEPEWYELLALFPQRSSNARNPLRSGHTFNNPLRNTHGVNANYTGRPVGRPKTKNANK